MTQETPHSEAVYLQDIPSRNTLGFARQVWGVPWSPPVSSTLTHVASVEGLLVEKRSRLCNRSHHTHLWWAHSSSNWYVVSTHSKEKREQSVKSSINFATLRSWLPTSLNLQSQEMETTVTASKLVLSTLFKLKCCLVVVSNGHVADRLYGLISHRHWVYDGTLSFFWAAPLLCLLLSF